MSTLSQKIDQLLREARPDSTMSLSFILVRWENGQQVRVSPSLADLSLYEKERLIESLTESIRELEAVATGTPLGVKPSSGEAGAEKIYLDYRDILLTSKRILLRDSNTTYLISEIRRPRIESSSRSLKQFSLWDTFFGPGITRSYEMEFTDKLVITVHGADVVVAEHRYCNFSEAGALYDRRAEFDALGLSDEERRRRVNEQHEKDDAGSQGSRNWGARQRYLKRVAEAIGAAIAGV